MKERKSLPSGARLFHLFTFLAFSLSSLHDSGLFPEKRVADVEEVVVDAGVDDTAVAVGDVEVFVAELDRPIVFEAYFDTSVEIGCELEMCAERAGNLLVEIQHSAA